MDTLTHIVLLISAWLFRFLIFVSLIVTAGVVIFGTPNRIEKALVDANAYQRFIPAVIASNEKSAALSTIPLNDPEVQRIIKQAFPPQTLQADTQAVIDSFYNWLKGKSPQPNYAVDFSPNVSLLAKGLSNYAFNRLASLPICQQVAAEIDPFSARCQPKDYNYVEAQSELQTSLEKDGAILPQKRFTVHDLPKMSNGQTIVERFSYAPTIYTIAFAAPAILIGLIPITALFIIWLSDHKRRTIQALGYTMLTTTLLLILTPLVFSYFSRHLTSSFQSPGAATGSDIQAISADVSNKLNSAFNGLIIEFGIIAAGVGLLVILGERMTRPKSKYANVRRKTGLVSSIAPRANNGRLKLDPAKVPLQSSEISVTKKAKSCRSKKYRKIQKGEF
jgi:hypothetical protein